jgi:hydroxyquinol 1,2-dioxygenase
MSPFSEKQEQKIEDLTADNLTEHVIKTCTVNTPNERTKELVSGLIRHVHEYVREVKLKPGEWETGWQYLTQVSRMSSVIVESN